MAMSTAKPHILVYPYPTAGHVTPLLDLTRRLLARGLSVTVLITENNLSLLQPLLSSHQSLHPLIFPYPEASNANGSFNLHTSLHDLHYPLLLQWLRSQKPPPAVMIFDFFLGWTHQLASEVGLPHVVFSPSGAFGLSMFFTLWRDLPKVEDPNNGNSLVTFPNLPNCPVFPWYQLPPLYTRNKEGEAIWEFRKNVWLGNMASWGVVLNTSTELERVYIENMKKELGHDFIWAVGPVLPQDDDVAGRGGSSSMPCHDLMAFLDARGDGSVVYVCFGSRVVLTRKQIDPLAAALEKSGVHFVWCVKQPDEQNVAGDYGDIPDGFLDRVAGRSYIIKGWAPQVEILKHRAVGAFLTHCGWNSTLEGTVAGVVMLAWPMRAEQFMNARVLVEDLGLGIRVGEGTQNIPESNELARLLSESVNGARAERGRAKQVKEAVLKAVAEGGSSYRELDEFVKSIRSLNE
ncbi:flavonol 3-O-glucosyltransferase UGT89B1-like [Mangifera indica]|uniref:flavonol 3-O-glucosyltransferase UGT89B1-like n=1 Tax=Mangifera indica TaxID=29780 RepID=UPI001CFBB1C7|nr:flavonol 3-O-glucosyltransferase UGT89B1-like [Mangifera indica]